MMTPTSSGDIHLLPEHIVDQIKAGEVIERPATLLKELLENSIDAKASRVSIHIINNGLDLISVEDNGVGIEFEQLPLAFCRHATSKINIFEDLYRLNSYGFRGEALASMASVSKLTCISQKENQPEGTILFHGGELISHRQDSDLQGEAGTKIYVKDLFYNTPVRIKFMQSQTSEKNQLKKIINAFILTHPEVEFSVKWDDSPKELFPIIDDEEIHTRVKKTFEKKKDPLELLSFSNEYDGVEVKVILSHNASKGNAGKFHYLFINDRFVQDTQLHKVVLNSAQSIWPFGLTGNYVVYVNIASDQLDVNVHPNKTVVKLFQPSKVLSLLSSSIKKNIPQSRVYNHAPEVQNTSMDMQDSSINFKGINYRHQDFSDNQTLDNYFNNLDSTSTDNPNQESIERLFFVKDKNILLYKREGSIILFDTQKLLRKYVDYLFSSQQDFTPMPLLVSSPINLTKTVSNNFLSLLSKFGFELDYLNEKTLVLRSFPKCLSSLPYQDITKSIIENEKHIIKENKVQLSSQSKIDFLLNDRLFNEIQLRLNSAELVSEGIVKELNSEDFLKLL